MTAVAGTSLLRALCPRLFPFLLNIRGQKLSGLPLFPGRAYGRYGPHSTSIGAEPEYPRDVGICRRDSDMHPPFVPDGHAVTEDERQVRVQLLKGGSARDCRQPVHQVLVDDFLHPRTVSRPWERIGVKPGRLVPLAVSNPQW